jgi:hypothetical protein
MYWSYILIYKYGRPVTPIDVLKLYLFTNMEDHSDTGKCTDVILIYKHGKPQ